jgi:hypothetical protein
VEEAESEELVSVAEPASALPVGLGALVWVVRVEEAVSESEPESEPESVPVGDGVGEAEAEAEEEGTRPPSRLPTKPVEVGAKEDEELVGWGVKL